MSSIGMERHEPPVFELGQDETGGPAFFWRNPWSGRRETIANLWWPTHPPEATETVEHIFKNLRLIYDPSYPEDTP